VTLLVTSAASAAAPLRLENVGNVNFPDRAFALTTAKAERINPRAVHVLENGQPVLDQRIVPARAAGKGTFGIVLVIDASASMSGAPIANAIDAARAFAAQRTANERLGIVLFNKNVSASLTPTTNADAITKSLAAAPKVAVGTHIYDAVDAAISLLHQASVTVASVVLLSDGADTGSALTFQNLVAKAQAEHVRIFTVGLHSPQFRASALQKLAARTDAVYSDAVSPAALAPIYQSLSSRLSRDYLVEYKSLAGPDTLVHVQVTIDGFPGTARSSYRTPALAVNNLPPSGRTKVDRFCQSSATVAVVAVIAGALTALGLIALIRSMHFTLRRRIGYFVSNFARLNEKAAEEQTRLFAAAERALERTRWWDRFAETVEIAEFPIPGARLVFLTAGASLLLAFIFALALPSIFILFGLAVPPLATRMLVKRKLNERRSKFADQLPDNLAILAAALRVGHSFTGALSVMIEEAEEPARSEFRRAVSDERLGVPVEEALIAVAKRMENGDLEQVALVASLQRQTGGNTAEVLDTVVESIRERGEIRRLVRTLTAQGRLAQWILTALPLFLLVIFSLVNPSYMHPLYHTTVGQLMLLAGALMVAAGFMIIGRIVDIKV